MRCGTSLLPRSFIIDRAKNYPEIGRSLHPKPVADQYSKSRGESTIVAFGKEPGKDPMLARAPSWLTSAKKLTIQMMSTNWNTKLPWTERSRVPGLYAVMNGPSQ
jgi:hypothetical protein